MAVRQARPNWWGGEVVTKAELIKRARQHIRECRAYLATAEERIRANESPVVMLNFAATEANLAESRMREAFRD